MRMDRARGWFNRAAATPKPKPPHIPDQTASWHAFGEQEELRVARDRVKTLEAELHALRRQIVKHSQGVDGGSPPHYWPSTPVLSSLPPARPGSKKQEEDWEEQGTILIGMSPRTAGFRGGLSQKRRVARIGPFDGARRRARGEAESSGITAAQDKLWLGGQAHIYEQVAAGPTVDVVSQTRTELHLRGGGSGSNTPGDAGSSDAHHEATEVTGVPLWDEDNGRTLSSGTRPFTDGPSTPPLHRSRRSTGGLASDPGMFDHSGAGNEHDQNERESMDPHTNEISPQQAACDTRPILADLGALTQLQAENSIATARMATTLEPELLYAPSTMATATSLESMSGVVRAVREQTTTTQRLITKIEGLQLHTEALDNRLQSQTVLLNSLTSSNDKSPNANLPQMDSIFAASMANQKARNPSYPSDRTLTVLKPVQPQAHSLSVPLPTRLVQPAELAAAMAADSSGCCKAPTLLTGQASAQGRCKGHLASMQESGGVSDTQTFEDRVLQDEVESSDDDVDDDE